jgi:hypothetical protein
MTEKDLLLQDFALEQVLDFCQKAHLILLLVGLQMSFQFSNIYIPRYDGKLFILIFKVDIKKDTKRQNTLINDVYLNNQIK